MRLQRRVVLTMVGVVLLTIAGPSPSHGDEGDPCGGAADMTGASAHCVRSGDDTNAYMAGHSDHTYSIRPACQVEGLALCSAPATCHIGDHDGWLYNVYEDDSPDPLDWQACLTKQEAQRLGGLTPAVVEHAFQRLS